MNQAVSISEFPHTSAMAFVRSLQVAFWIFFSPSIWYTKIQALRPNLAPNFCLAELDFKDFFSRAGKSLLLTPILGWPFLIFILALILGGFGFLQHSPSDLVNHALLGAGVAFCTSLVMSICISFNAGLSFGILCGLVFALLPASSGVFYLALGFSAGLSGAILRIHLQKYTPIRFNIRNLGATTLWLALLAGFIIVGLSIASEFFFDNEINVNSAYQNPLTASLLLADAFLVGASIILMLAPRTNRLAKWLIPSIVITISLMALTFGVRETAPEAGTGFFVLSGLGNGFIFTILFGLPFSIINLTGWKRPAIYLGSVSAGCLWVPIALFIVKDFNFDPTMFVLTPLAVLVGLTARLWRPLLFFPLSAIWNLFLYSTDQGRLPHKPSVIRYHPIFWDEMSYFSWQHLDQHLALLARHEPKTARQIMFMHISGRQREAVFQSLLELSAEELETLERIEDLDSRNLPPQALLERTPFSGILDKFHDLSNDVSLAEAQTNPLNVRSSLASVRGQLADLKTILQFSQETYAVRFLPAVAHWQQLLTERLDYLAQAAETSQQIHNPYVFGVPIKKNQGVFVGREEIFSQIEELLLAPLRPPLYLYGQRRMGKTSLLLNLASTLPSTVLPLFVDCQALAGSRSYAEIFYGMVKQVVRSAAKHQTANLPLLSIQNMPLESPFLAINQWLDEVEEILTANKQMGLLVFDEFVVLDEIFSNAGLKPDDFLMLLRHIIQHRERFRVLISGSHSLLGLDSWAGYLINMHTIKLGYLQENEARSLIVAPVNDFPLVYQPEALSALLELTHRHPALLQIMGYELVERKNSQPTAQRYRITPEDIEAVIPAVLDYGAFYFEDIKTQIPGDALKMLTGLALKGKGAQVSAETWQAEFPHHFQLNLQKLLEHDLIEPAGQDQYRLQIELVRRWLQQRMAIRAALK